MPDAAPVTTAIWFWSRPMKISSVFGVFGFTRG
jgi:hypothetical protein